MPRHSQIQLQVLSLYKEFLRISKNKPGMNSYIRSEFKKHAQIPRTDTLRIEQLLRRGQRQLDLISTVNVESVGVFVKEEKK
ncbi:hypothetical protein KUTeg_013260 [Tegillarca granosa]|uniref:Complex 1 LYR protein domain-containing protein n=1 Tax=Tegillarca granosa TaxID=220873 RepID=A0ABQ9EVL2_TEGGR|nr:hypothetical protein KUTeg_013260 [Tegillarca granosa]